MIRSPRASASARRDGSRHSYPTEPTAIQVPSERTPQRRSYCSRGLLPGKLGGSAGSSERLQPPPLPAETKTGQSPIAMDPQRERRRSRWQCARRRAGAGPGRRCSGPPLAGLRCVSSFPSGIFETFLRRGKHFLPCGHGLNPDGAPQVRSGISGPANPAAPRITPGSARRPPCRELRPAPGWWESSLVQP